MSNLILLKAPRPTDRDGFAAEGMVRGKFNIEAGEPPPWLIPHCWQCRVPVERFTIDYIASPFYLPIQYQCHGVTGGSKVSYLTVLDACGGHGGLLWVFTNATYKTQHGKRRTS